MAMLMSRLCPSDLSMICKDPMERWGAPTTGALQLLRAFTSTAMQTQHSEMTESPDGNNVASQVLQHLRELFVGVAMPVNDEGQCGAQAKDGACTQSRIYDGT